MRRSFNEMAIIITGEVPMTVLDAARLRSAAKVAVRQALLDAADALLNEPEVDEGIHPQDLNATNDD